MEFSPLVMATLRQPDKCLCSLLGKLVDGQSKTNCIVAIVEHADDHGVFIYSVVDMLTTKPSDLRLQHKVPVDASMEFNIVSQNSDAQGFLLIRIKGKRAALTFELPQGDKLGTLLQELKRTKQVSSHNEAFAEPSTFEWMDNYKPSNGRPATDHSVPSRHNSLRAERPSSDVMHALSASCDITPGPVTVASLAPPEIKKNRSLQDLSNKSADLADRRARPSSAKCASDSPDGISHKQFGREKIADLLLKQRQHEYTERKTFRVFCGTWNVNGLAALCDLRTWLSPVEDSVPPDIYAVGFQELDLSKNAYIFNASSREDEWYSKVAEALHYGAKYVKLKLVRLVGIMLVVFIEESLLSFVQDCSIQTVGTGLLGMMGNKGGVGVRLQLHDTTICFVCSHLAAHMEDVEGRNQDFRDITSRLVFDVSPSLFSISDHEMVFWLGDLNYRMSDIDLDECKKKIAQGKFAELLQNNDQLVNQMANKRAFLDYLEGPINFQPTYKYDPGTDTWDSSDKCRLPAWCDRVLWRGGNIKQLVYRSHPYLRISDHKPVSAIFHIGVKLINKDLEKKVREDVMKLLDQKENEYLPQVSLDTTEIRFENVKFIELQRQSITVTNTGQVPVQFEFINKLNDSHYCKLWLSVDPAHGYMNIGDKTTIQFEIYVDKKTAPALNKAKEQIDDILVLHLQGGKDIFVTVTGTYLPSCFGSAIEDLVLMYAPVRDSYATRLANQPDAHSNSLVPLDVPKELWRLVDFIYLHGITEDELFQLPGLHSEITSIRESLDTQTAEPLPGTVHSVAEALLTLLESFAEPVIPYKFYYKCLEAQSNFTLCKQILSHIPVCHRNVFKYICSFLRKLLTHSKMNKLDAKFLATVFGTLMLRPPPGDNEPAATSLDAGKAREDNRRRAQFVYNFLTNDYDE